MLGALCLAVSAAPLAAEVAIGRPEPTPAGGPILLRIMTYNLHHGVDPGGQAKLPEMTRFLNDNSLDLVGLEEVDRNWSARSGFQDQALALAAETGLHLAFFPTLTRGPESSYGLAVLSRYPVARQVSGLYSEAKEPRGYLGIEATVAGRPVTAVVEFMRSTARRKQRCADPPSGRGRLRPGLENVQRSPGRMDGAQVERPG